MTRVKRIYLISLVNRSHAFYDFFVELASTTDPAETGLCFLHPLVPDLMKELEPLGFNLWHITYAGKGDMPLSILKLIRLFIRQRPEVVHAHLFDASICTMIAARICAVPKRFHTRHHASYHHDYFPSAVKYDRFINRHSTHIVAVSEGIRKLLIDREGVSPLKVTTIHHGFNLRSFSEVNDSSVIRLRKKYGIPSDKFIVACISRYTAWKGVQYTIDAFKKFHAHHPDSFLVLANAGGDYEVQIKQQLGELPANSYVEIEFERDIASLYALMNVFVHVPIDQHSEAFGQVYVESLASGVPMICTLSGIALELAQPHDYFRTVPYHDAEAIFVNLKELAENYSAAKLMAEKGRRVVAQQFGIQQMVSRTLEGYEGK